MKFTELKRRIIWMLLAITLVSRLALAFRSDANHASRLFEDDSYYMFSCARHLALGDGLTVDGTHPTNGIQPLIVFIEAPFFWAAGGDRWLGVRLCFIPLAIFSAISVLLVAKILKRIVRAARDDGSDLPIWRNPVIIGAAFWTFAYPMLAEMMNGLETGLYSMLLLLTIYLYIKIEQQHEQHLRDYLLLGVVLGLLVLARIDALFFLAAIGVSEIIRKRKAGLWNTLILGGLALLISAPWWIYNFTWFGSIIPISGQAESLGRPTFMLNIIGTGAALADILSTFFALPYNAVSSPYSIPWAIAVPIVVLAIAWLTKAFALLNKRIDLAKLLPFVIASILLMLVYVLKFHSSHFIHRYLQPIRILWFFAAAVVLAELATRFKKSGWTVRIVVVIFLFAGAGFGALHYIHDFAANWTADLYEAGLWARQHPNDRVGMSQSGVSGFTADNIVNLDGKVNADVLHAREADTLGRYIAHANLEYIADWTDLSAGLVHDAERAGSHYTLVDSLNLVRIYRRVP